MCVSAEAMPAPAEAASASAHLGKHALAAPVGQPGSGASYPEMIDAMRRAVGANSIHIVASLNVRSRAAAKCITKTGQNTDLHHPSRAAACAHAVAWSTASRGASEALMSTSSRVGSPLQEMMRFGEAPFHSLALADPTQTQMGYGFFSGKSPNPVTKFTVSVNVTGGRYSAGRPSAPIMAWPPSGWSVSGTTVAGSEWPDPVDLCGWSSGGPAIWFARPGAIEATAASHLVLRNAAGRSVHVRWCLIDAESANFRDPNAAATARGWLRWMNAEILIPSTPLKGQYALSARVNGHPVTLPFTAT
jgi:hypothetical protein